MAAGSSPATPARNKYAEVAQLVERHVANVEVASSSLAARTIFRYFAMYPNSSRKLFSAIRDNNFEALKIAIARGTPVNATDKDYVGYPLNVAAWYGRMVMVDYLLSVGATLAPVKLYSESSQLNYLREAIYPIIEAVHQGKPASIACFLKCGVSLEMEDASRTAILFAVGTKYAEASRKVDCLNILISHGANLHHKDKNGFGVFDYLREPAVSACKAALDGQFVHEQLEASIRSHRKTTAEDAAILADLASVVPRRRPRIM